MSEQHHISVTEDAATVLRRLRTMPQRLVLALCKAMDRENQLSIAHIQRDFLSFPKDGPAVAIGCRVMTGMLRRSIWSFPSVPNGQQIVSGIGSNLIYAASQEFGADIPAQVIRPKTAKALRFRIGDRIIFAREVRLPARHIEGRHFIRRGITDRLAQYAATFSRTVIEVGNQNN